MNRPDQKSITVGTRTLESLVSEWRDFKGTKPVGDVIPPGWICTNEFAVVKGLGTAAARARLVASLNAGMLQRRRFNVLLGQQLRAVWYYRKK
jgi:hypothetical protein